MCSWIQKIFINSSSKTTDTINYAQATTLISGWRVDYQHNKAKGELQHLTRGRRIFDNVSEETLSLYRRPASWHPGVGIKI